MTISDDELLALAKKAVTLLPGEWSRRDGISAWVVCDENGHPFLRSDPLDFEPMRDVTGYIAAANPQTIISLIERHRAEMEAVTRERDEHRMAAAIRKREGDDARAALAAERKRVGELEAALKPCADELAQWIANFYTKMHPSEQAEFDEQMAIMHKARAALKERADG